jgi:hypothetical protein
MKPLKLTLIGFRGLTNLYEVGRAFVFVDHHGTWHSVPRGFVTDGASFPSWLKFIPLLILSALNLTSISPWDALLWALLAQSIIGFPVHRAYSEAAVAHDWLYQRGMGKVFADNVFVVMIARKAFALRAESLKTAAWPAILRPWRCALRRVIADLVLVYRLFRAVVMWIGVLLGGWFAYRSHRKRRA